MKLRQNRAFSLALVSVGLAVLLVWAISAYFVFPSGDERPNLVLIIGDDHGYPYSGFMGSAIVKTPHLDKLAREGTVFTTGYNTSSLCRPSLRSLLTGLDPLQWQLRVQQIQKSGGVKPGTPEVRNFRTLPSLLSLRGYRSFQAGKHWEGSFRDAGFSEGSKGPKIDEQDLISMAGGHDGLEIGRITMKPVLDFLARAEGEPFLLWFAPLLPHAPMDASNEYVRSHYAGLGLSRSAELYYANVSRLDDAVGELVAALGRLQLRSRTLIVYVSDNGWKNDPHEEIQPTPAGTGGAGGKGSMKDFGFRTPIVFNWPGRVPGGKVRNDLVSTLDLLPTLLDYAGLESPVGRPGRSLRPGIHDQRSVSRPEIVGHQASKAAWPGDGDAQLRRAYFVRTATQHYIWYPDSDREEIYDHSLDPDELRNVASTGTNAKWFRKRIANWRKRVSASLPRKEARSDAWRRFR